MTKCPSCGFEEANLNVVHTSEMHRYWSADNTKMVILNDNRNEVLLGEVTYIRADKRNLTTNINNAAPTGTVQTVGVVVPKVPAPTPVEKTPILTVPKAAIPTTGKEVPPTKLPTLDESEKGQP